MKTGDEQVVVRTSTSIRFLGQAVRFAGVFGVLLSLTSLVIAPFAVSRMISASDGWIQSLQNELPGMGDELYKLSDVIGVAENVAAGTGDSLTRMGDSMDHSRAAIHSVGELLAEQTPALLEDTLDALEAATEGARAIDRVLRGLASLGPLTGVTYDPEQPLDLAIIEVSASLEPLPEDLRSISEALAAATDDLDRVYESIGHVSRDLGSFAEKLSAGKEQLRNLAGSLDQFSTWLDAFGERLPRILWISLAVFEIIVVWIGLGQYAVFHAGTELAAVHAERPRDADVPENG
jgi:hypothetical protein